MSGRANGTMRTAAVYIDNGTDSHLHNRFGIDNVITKHRLHSFSREYFKGGNLFTYSAGRYEASMAFTSAKSKHTFCEKPIDVEDLMNVSISEFESFFISSPPSFFLSKYWD